MDSNSKRARSFVFATIAVMALASCGGGNQSSSISGESSSGGASSSSSQASFNPDNFITPTNEVNTTKLVTYDGPSIMETSKKAGINVEGTDLFVYETRVNHQRKFSWAYSEDYAPLAIFDFEGRVHVEITIKEDVAVESALVRPLAYGIEPSIESNVISFDLSYSDNYAIEYNGDSDTAIHLFANPIEEDPITEEEAAQDDSIVYIGPGVYSAESIPCSSGTTIYLAGGSYVYGKISCEQASDITVRGRGIISGSIYERRSDSEFTVPIVFRNCSDIHIEGVTFLDPAGWAFNLYKCDNVTIDNAKVVTARANGDGVSVQSCSNVQVNGGFYRTWDDTLVVKNEDRGTTSHVVFDGCSVWTDLAQCMEVGYETNGPTMDDITFENITIMHAYHKAAISIHNCDDADITNVTYKNITIEDGSMLGDDRTDLEDDYLIDFTIAFNATWTESGGERGTIDGVTISNVDVQTLEDSITCRMSGESATSSIQNVNISGLMIKGTQVTSVEALKLYANQYVSGVSISASEKVTGAIITLPYKLSLADSNVDKTNVEGIEQDGLLVPDFAISTADLAFIGVKGDISTTPVSTHSAGNKTTTPADDGSGDFTQSGSSVSALFDGNRNTEWSNADWKGEESEFAALTMDFASSATIGVIRLLCNSSNPYFYTYGIQVWGRKVKTDGSMNDKYTRLVALKEYDVTPASGNAIDINITAQVYGGLQLRLYAESGVSSPERYSIAEIEFYPPSLTFGASIVDATDHNDVYNIEKAVDGDTSTYYESKEIPAHIVIDMGKVYSINAIVLYLPPSLAWTTRTENIQILVSDSNLSYSASTTAFDEIVPSTDYTFDPSSGNRNMITLDASVNARFIKFVINSNDVAGGYDAQLSEISVYGV